MITRLTNFAYKLLGSFWLIPTAMAILGALSAHVFISLDILFSDMGYDISIPPLVGKSLEGGQATLSTVASSMVSVVSVTFSVTIVALTMASSQFGPRLLGTILRDRRSQACLGVFLLTYLHCLLVLRSFDALSPDTEPRLSVAMGLTLGVLSFFVLIYFIQHVALSIKADQVIALVFDDLRENIERLYPLEYSLDELHQETRALNHEQVEEEPQPEPSLPKDFSKQAHMVRSRTSGYVQAMDNEWVVGVAEYRDMVVRMLVRPGDFIMAGGRIAEVWPYEKFDQDVAYKLRNSIVLGSDRTLYQDLEYAILQLVEVAVRALSPGINDPHTAIACVDRLGVALADLARRDMGSPWRLNKDGRVRVQFKPFTFEGAVEASFHKIRQAMVTAPTVGIHMLDVLVAIADVAPKQEQRDGLLEQGRMVLSALERVLGEENDIADSQSRFQKLRRVVHGAPVA
ncbi:DUF2254 domain-containing protein [Oceanidesulfovibrio marinus]|uniref:DUF2254 domain-containing protein n=1 Tax=Oceanidesulfovibrio marinus TaxID=370038 RepID=A0A6P1ZH16_9BACT|nr:DUF2254 domain-containing protein [Oceanidesulfovibrio marinus]TVM32836.1 DUF2254 domain-containing protein [Oceanidesulfovibrio marinus]